MDTVRAALNELIRTRGEDYASISKLLGRNAAYIQQFIRRGVPKKLDEDDRRTLARYFDVEEVLLGGHLSASASASDLQPTFGDKPVVVPRLAVDASAGPGGHNEAEPIAGAIAFDPKWLRRINVRPQGLSMIQVQGDSMVPTLTAGDDIMVDRNDSTERLRDGIYVLRVDGALLVKRLAVNPATRGFIIRSDNESYPDWVDVDLAQVELVGRVVWVGRRVS